MQDHTINPAESKTGVYFVTNNKTKDNYKVDTKKPSCSCLAYKYTKTNKAGRKRLCKHIKVARGIKLRKV